MTCHIKFIAQKSFWAKKILQLFYLFYISWNTNSFFHTDSNKNDAIFQLVLGKQFSKNFYKQKGLWAQLLKEKTNRTLFFTVLKERRREQEWHNTKTLISFYLSYTFLSSIQRKPLKKFQDATQRCDFNSPPDVGGFSKLILGIIRRKCHEKKWNLSLYVWEWVWCS